MLLRVVVGFTPAFLLLLLAPIVTGLVALTGSLMGTLLTCVLAVIFTNVLKLDGGDTPYIVPLLSQSAMTIDPKALFYSFFVCSGCDFTAPDNLGGVAGCTHLRELLFNLATATFQTIHAAFQNEGDEPPRHLGQCTGWDFSGQGVREHYPQFYGRAPRTPKAA